jgi:hypothetical protein
MSDIDLDAILAQRAEATGEVDTVPFAFAGETWRIKHPLLADDEWKDELEDVDNADGIGIAQHYMGEEQYARFVAAGGRSGFVVLIIREVGKEMTDLTGDDKRPTRSSTSSRKRRKR